MTAVRGLCRTVPGLVVKANTSREGKLAFSGVSISDPPTSIPNLFSSFSFSFTVLYFPLGSPSFHLSLYTSFSSTFCPEAACEVLRHVTSYRNISNLKARDRGARFREDKIPSILLNKRRRLRSSGTTLYSL